MKIQSSRFKIQKETGMRTLREKIMAAIARSAGRFLMRRELEAMAEDVLKVIRDEIEENLK
jgi:hypothetical protein